MRKSPSSNSEHLSVWRIARNSIRNVLGAVSIVSLVAAGGCASVKPTVPRAPAPQAKPADDAAEGENPNPRPEEKVNGQEDQAEKSKGKTKKPKEEKLKIDIQKCDYHGTCPVV